MRAMYTVIPLVLLLVMAVPSGLDSCAISPAVAVFVARQRPVNIGGEFLKGNIGVIQTSYEPKYLVAAFRILAGVPLTGEEVRSMSLGSSPPSVDPYGRPPAYEGWLKVRKSLPELPVFTSLDIYKTVSRPGFQYSYANCQRHAFDKAVETFGDLGDRWGFKDPRLLEWVKAQDQVFENCSTTESPVVPATPQPDADPLLAAHRRYQIAAAHFYAGQLREASQEFQRIAEEKESPWRSIAPYLAARALLRAGLVNNDREAFQEGKERLTAILSDSAQEEWHESCRGLLHLWQIRVEPEARLAELGNALMRPRDENVNQELIDFLYLVENRARQPRATLGATGDSEIAAWMLAMSPRQPPADTGEESLAWWRKSRHVAWLVPSLIHADEKSLPELIHAARSIPPSSSAYQSVTYYAMAREIKIGHRESARRWADRVLRQRLLLSTRNMILQQRLSLARDWNEFLRFAPRRPEPNFYEYEGHEIAAQEDASPRAPAITLIQDSQHLLDAHVPLALWEDATRNSVLPAHIQLRIAFAGWMRAAMLRRDDEARRLLRRAVELQPAGALAAKDFLESRNSEEARFAALLMVLRAPSLCPSVPSSVQPTPNLAERRTNFTIGGYRATCWIPHSLDGATDRNAGFLTPQQRAEGEKEANEIYGQQTWEATFLLRESVAWAKKHPDDRRVPEALHGAVLAARFRGIDKDTGAYSKQAFDLLHRQYPKSPWTTQTPYWYK